jgi:phosphatidylglycerophosphate synthase
MMTTIARRELATRHRSWAKNLAAALARAGATPNAISLASIGCAGASAIAFAVAGATGGRARATWWLLAAAAIQLRLLCNLLDGMLAVEEGLQTPVGPLFNEVPDRIADVLVLAGAGCAIRALPGGVELGWTAAAAALFTAYIRQLGGALTGTQHFGGPMAKQHRMFTLTVASGLAAIEAIAGAPARAMPTMAAALAVVIAGSAWTSWRRLALIARELEDQ